MLSLSSIARMILSNFVGDISISFFLCFFYIYSNLFKIKLLKII